MENITSVATLFSFIDEQTEDIIALTGDAVHLQKMAGGNGATISVDCIVLLWGTRYIVSDILINTLKEANYFDPSEYEDLAVGAGFHYTISIRLMVNEALN